MRRVVVTVISLLLLILCVRGAYAQEESTRTFIRMEEVEIIGLIEHPEITYIIPKTRIRFKHQPLERDFTEEATRIFNPLEVRERIKIHNLMGTTPGP